MGAQEWKGGGWGRKIKAMECRVRWCSSLLLHLEGSNNNKIEHVVVVGRLVGEWGEGNKKGWNHRFGLLGGGGGKGGGKPS